MMQDYLIFTGVNVLLAWSVYIILLAGNLSFANGAFMALGAYISGLLTVRAGMSLPVALGVAAVITGMFGALISIPALRARGVYLILVTVGLSLSVGAALESIPLVGGIQGFGGLMGTELWHVAMAVVMVGILLGVVVRSPLQRVFDAIREDENVARSLGINTLYVKVVTFGVGASVAAVAGTLYGHYMMFIRPEHFNIMISIFAVLYVVLGGVRNPLGPLLGAAIMTLAPEMIRSFADWRPTIFGLLIVVVLLVRPAGILSFRIRTAKAPSERGGAS